MSTSEMAKAVPESLIGLIIDHRYEVLSKIGEGGIGAVFLARDRRMMDRAVVVKVLLENWLDNPEIRRKFEHEKEALSRIDHPGVVGILDAGTIPGNKPYLVMPFVPGQTLEQILRQDSLPTLEFCADVVEAVAETLSIVHTKGILHRDIKPENIIIETVPDRKPRVRLIDFGIARVLDSQISPVTHVERSIGTVWYVAPEQLLGNLEQTTTADVFSLAVVAYVMLTGQRPFDPKTIVEMAVLHQEGPKRLPSQIDPRFTADVDKVLSRALLYDPKLRTSDALEFGEALASALRRLSRSSPVAPITKGHVRATPTLSEKAPPAPVAPPKVDDVKTSLPVKMSPASTALSFLSSKWTLGGLAMIAVVIIAAGVTAAVLWRGNSRPLISAPPLGAGPDEPINLSRLGPGLKISFEAQSDQDTDFRPLPIQSLERTPFSTGSKIRITVASNLKGSLYLFSEDDLGQKAPIFDLLFPGENQKGFPYVDAGVAVVTPVEFTREPGSETIWFVWTAEPIRSLDEARINALRNMGTVKDEHRSQELGSFFRTYKSEDYAARTDPDGSAVVAGGEGTVIFRMLLDHR